jgi:hypothetical protein
VSAMDELLARSTAIGTTNHPLTGDELVLWRTDKGMEFSTSYDMAAKYGRS